VIDNEQWYEFMTELGSVRLALQNIDRTLTRMASAAEQRNQLHEQFNAKAREHEEKMLAAQSDAIERGFTALGKEMNAAVAEEMANELTAEVLERARTAPPEPSPVRITHLEGGGTMENIG